MVCLSVISAKTSDKTLLTFHTDLIVRSHFILIFVSSLFLSFLFLISAVVLLPSKSEAIPPSIVDPKIDSFQRILISLFLRYSSHRILMSYRVPILLLILLCAIAGSRLPSAFASSADVCDHHDEFEVFRCGIENKCHHSLLPRPPLEVPNN